MLSPIRCSRVRLKAVGKKEKVGDSINIVREVKTITIFCGIAAPFQRFLIASAVPYPCK